MKSDGERRKKEEINKGAAFIDEGRAGTEERVFLLEVNGRCVVPAFLSM